MNKIKFYAIYGLLAHEKIAVCADVTASVDDAPAYDVIEAVLPDGADAGKNADGETLIDFCGGTYMISECIKQHADGTYWIEVYDGNGYIRKKLASKSERQ